jgi:asparagine synthase (glutamine-hydrolysing)
VCGIAGIATTDGLRPDDPRLLDAMLKSLAHRGPDDQHTRGDDCALIGARRLSIIDLDGGRQPLTDESGLIVATQNGEIYNYLELQEDLRRRGHVFRTKSDTETIVHLYEEHGTDFICDLRGMFAIAIWDARLRRLVLARDRLGKKPLYWRLAGNRLTYGSELKAILEESDVERAVDPHALELYLQYNYVPAPWTILQGIHKLPPAGILTWDGGTPNIQRYWSPEYQPKTRRGFDEDVAEGLEIIREAVRLRLRSDVPVGVFLSGGMDSSVVTALMAEASPEPVRTFSIGFEDQTYDELPYARAVAKRYGTIHTEDVVRLDAIALLPKLAEHFDEPFGDSSAVPTFRVSQLAAESLKVVLSGDGGDESFGGYVRYRAHRLFTALDAVPRPLLRWAARSGRRAAAPLGDRWRLQRRLGTAEAMFGYAPDERYVRLMTILDQGDRIKLLAGRDGSTSAYLLAVLRDGPDELLDRMLRADLLTYLPEDLLVKMDRATMANSLEARAPLLDHKLVEFAARLPVDRKIAGRTTKVLLRAIAKQLMPAELVDRPKMGFGVPIGQWFRGQLGDRFEELVLASDAASRDHLDPTAAAALLRDHRAGRADHDHRLWLLLMFELWGRRWLNRGAARSEGAVGRPTGRAANDRTGASNASSR